MIGKQFAPAKPIVLKNKTCTYCGIELSGRNKTKEHVIGRKFVPKGSLDSQWNLIVNACSKCNCIKSDLEDDISAITMQPDSYGQFATSDKVLKKDAIRKGLNSISRKTKKKVKDSSETIKIKVDFFSNIQFSCNVTSPPQIDEKRIYSLARLQVMAFFYLITYDYGAEKGRFWPGVYAPLIFSIKSDWGNCIQRQFMQQVAVWDARFLGVGAGEYFKIVIRKHPSETCWSFSLEWNVKYRIIGFFGDEKVCKNLIENYSPMKIRSICEGHDTFIRYKEDEKLDEKDDILFVLKELDYSKVS